MKLSFFPKEFGDYDAAGLARLVRDLGLHTVNVVIREGFWVHPSRVESELPDFIRVLRREGVRAWFASTSFPPALLARNPKLMEALARSGIRQFRLGWLRAEGRISPARALEQGRRDLECVARHCQKLGLQAVLQLHHDTLVPSPSAAYFLTRDLPLRSMAVELDPGNQSREGWENWERSLRLLGRRARVVGLKDSAADRRTWVPLGQGILDWPALAAGLLRAGFDGLYVFMPFYRTKNREAALKKEVFYFRSILDKLGAKVS